MSRYRHAAPFLSSLMSISGTAGVPSTTVTSLSSLGTGLTPGQHGLVGFTARIPGTELLLNHLTWDQPVDPLEWQPHQTAFGMLAAEGVAVTTVNKREFQGSGLTVAATRGAEFVGANKVGERIACVLSAARRSPSLTYLYDGDLDWTGHRYGVSSTAWLQQLAMIDAEAEQLREALPSSTRLVIVADHGMIDSPVGSRIDVDERLELSDGVALVGGEARFRHLYCHRWRSRRGGRHVARDPGRRRDRPDPRPGERQGLVRAGRPDRCGSGSATWSSPAHGDTAIMCSQAFPYEMTLVGLHGSLTPDEMLIPILIACTALGLLGRIQHAASTCWIRPKPPVGR